MPLSQTQRTQLAIHSTQFGRPVATTAKKYPLNRDYLRRRIASIPTRTKAQEDRQLLSPYNKGRLAS